MEVPESSHPADPSADTDRVAMAIALSQNHTLDSSPQSPTFAAEQLDSAAQIGIDRRCWNTHHTCFAAITPVSFVPEYGNPCFHRWFHIDSDRPTTWLTPWSEASHEQIYRQQQQHLLYRVFQTRWRTLAAPSTLNNSVVLRTELSTDKPFRAIECWLNSEQLAIAETLSAAQSPSQSWLELSPDIVAAKLNDPKAIAELYGQVNWERYIVNGSLWLGGVEVTQREQVLALNDGLLNPQMLARPTGHAYFQQHLQAVANAQQLLLCGVFQDYLRPLKSLHNTLSTLDPIPLEQLTDTAISRAIATYDIQSLPDLEAESDSPFCQHLRASGGRSLLVVPLTHHTHEANGRQAIAGLAVLISREPNAFHSYHHTQVTHLIPALKTALNLALQAMQQQRLIRNIHPSVECHFHREAERRGWGLPPEPIILKSLYPLYGISDIRGSSTERNTAIQMDLLEQFQLARNVVQAAYDTQPNAFCQQLQEELDQQLQTLQQGVTVDTEFAALDYLKKHVELYFDHFKQLGDATQQAVDAYFQLCEEGTIYRARATYDEVLNQINHHLRQMWEHCQIEMQRITPHYCDLEATDGIDHMIYAGEAIDPQFTLFHLRSLRYEQLRTMCRCARSMLALKQTLDIPLDVAHLVLVQATQIDIFHDEKTERLFDVRGTKDTRYEIVKKRIDKAVDQRSRQRITQPGMLTIVYSLDSEWDEYEQYLRYLQREGWVEGSVDSGNVEPLQGVTGLRFARVRVCPQSA
ncbi:GAF domain-containing protein [Vacuolonema iberomarrocanum]|uniref:GAF domain-containing protein n=1 Tax=Vacuolonema iberomarrocanum TaxID=3454632 RepID=UPI0019DD51D3|nr:GAF domain-containing protein [filamentous cyanobacterium LEGE 07170]